MIARTKHKISQTRVVALKSQLLILLIFLLSVCQSSRASLVILIYHNETLYIASDSAGTSYATGERALTVQKIYKIARYHCVAMTGVAFHTVENSSTKPILTLNVPTSLARLAAETVTNNEKLEQKMEFIATNLNTEYCSFFSNGAAITESVYDHERTRLLFSGYNPEKRCFTIGTCVLDGTNAVSVGLAKEYSGPTDPTPFVAQGEDQFINTLMSGMKPELTKLVSTEFLETVGDLVSTKDVSDSRVKTLVLEMFRLHKDNAARLGYSKGWIGPPYRIFKISTNSVVELSSDTHM